MVLLCSAMSSSSTDPRRDKRLEDACNDEDDSKPPAKRARKKGALTAATSITLPLDALSFIMEFLSPRQLFNLAFTCKTLRNFVTTKLVVCTSLIHGGHAKQTMAQLYKLMSSRKPCMSPPRFVYYAWQTGNAVSSAAGIW